MFKRTRFLLQEVKEKPKQILKFYKPNDEVTDFKVPFELRGEHLSRQKVNPYRKKPLKVTYDQSNFSTFVLPSQTSVHLGGIITL